MTPESQVRRIVSQLGLVLLAAFCALGCGAASADEMAADDWPEQTAERLRPFQGAWQAYDYGTDRTSWTLSIEGDTFRGEQGPDDWYTGTIRVHDDHDPGWIDLRITDSSEYHKGKTTHCIFRVAGETILMAAPPPNEARRKRFEKEDGGISVELKGPE